MTIENIISNYFKKMDAPSVPKKKEDPENPNDPNDPDYYSYEHDLFKLNEKGNIITDIPTQIRNLIVNEPCNMGLDCISLKEFTIKYGIHRILGLEKPEQVTYDYFDYKRNKPVILGPDSPLYILQNILTKKGTHTDPADPYHTEVLYPELSMDDIDPEMDMRELAHYMRPDSDFFVFVQDPNPNIINLSVRKHRYQIGNTLRTVTMSAGNIFKTKNPRETESIKSIHKKIASEPINLAKIPFEFDGEDVENHLRSLQISNNETFKRNEIFGYLFNYMSERSKLNLNLSYYDVYSNILDFAQKSRQFKFSENVQGFYYDGDLILNDLSKDLLKLKTRLDEFKKGLKGSDKKKKEINKELDNLKKLLPEDDTITYLQTFMNWKMDYIKFLNEVNSKIGSTLTFPSIKNFSTTIYLSKNEKLKYKNPKKKKEIYEKHLSKNEKIKNAIFQNLNRTTEKILGSNPFSHALGLIKNLSPITFIRTDDNFKPLKKFGKRVLTSLNHELIKNNRSKIAFYIIDHETKKIKPHFEQFDKDLNTFYRKYIRMIENAGDFSSLIPNTISITEPSNLTVNKKISINKNFIALFNKYMGYGLKHAFFSETDDFYTEEAEDLFKFGINSPQIYSCNGFNYIRLLEKEKKIVLENEKGSIILTDFAASSNPLNSPKSFFIELINSLKNQYHRLSKINYNNLNNIVYEKKHKAHILKIIALCVDIASETSFLNQKSPIQYIHFSQGLKLLKNVIELVDNYVAYCEKCSTIKYKLDESKEELSALYNHSPVHWDFFKNLAPLLNKESISKIKGFKRENPLFSTESYIMEARELWFDEQIKNMKIVISLLLNNPLTKSSETIAKLKKIIRDTNQIKRRQPSFEDFENIAIKIKTQYNKIKDSIQESETNEDLIKILRHIDNFIIKEIKNGKIKFTYTDFDK